MGDKDVYYHYTDRDSAQKIIQSGRILQSDPKHGDAVHGPGTYITKTPPSASTSHIVRNNYDGMKPHWETKMYDGKADVAIKVELPKSKVTDHSRRGRDIHRHHGDIPLPSNPEVYVRSDKGVQKFSK